MKTKPSGNMTNRRQFIKQVAAGYVSLLLFPACTRGTQKSSYQIFTPGEADCLACICEQFIPADDYAGAREAGCVNYIDKMLYQRFPELTEVYKTGLQSLESFCKETHGKVFSRLEWNVQTSLLEQMEEGKLTESFWEKTSQKDFFNIVLRHTMQGYYGSPRHGGNKDYVSFRMMKLDFPLLTGQNRYEK
jgi:gluconate 2-dehydrogenase gamma chain